MEQQHVINGDRTLFLSIFLSVFNWVSENGDLTIKIITAIGAIASALFAARYYHLAAKYKKIQIKKLEEDEEE